MEENKEKNNLSVETSLAIINEEESTALLAEDIKNIINVSDKSMIIQLIDTENSVDLAEAFNILDSDYALRFFSFVSDEHVLGDIFPYLTINKKEALISGLTTRKLSGVLSYVSTDDLVDFLEDCSIQIKDKLLNAIPSKRKQSLQKLSKFTDDTIGSIMTTDYLSIDSKASVQDVFDKIKKFGSKLETIRHIFIVDETNKLLGVERIEDMMFEKTDASITEVMSTDFAYILPTADKKEAIPICKKYDLPVLPVVSSGGEMLGIITFDDVMDVIEEANTEDLYKSAAISPSSTPYLETKTFRLARSYVIWLLILLVINTFAGIVISRFETALLTLPILTCFIPALNDSCGDAGDQTSSMVIRALGTNELTKKDYLKISFRELLAGFLTSLIVAIFAFGWVLLEMNANLINMDGAFAEDFIEKAGSLLNAEMIIAAVVAFAFLFGITFAKLFGVLLPLLAKAVHIDPAVMSGPLIASIMDLLTLFVYFAVALLLIDSIMPGEIVLTMLL